ncbi:MAG: tetratricopeptide repeat protein [bacterium]
MRKALVILLLACIALPVAIAQDEGFNEVESDNYRVLSQVGVNHAARTASKLEAMLQLYNSYFHFDIDELDAKLRVRIFESKSDFDSYLNRVIGETREDFIYLHYNDLARSELVGYYVEGEEFDYSLTHQNFVQYMRAFIANPPLWLREGFAVFFEQSQYDSDFETVAYRENLAWLGTLKDLVQGNTDASLIPMEQMLTIDIETARERINVFYPQAWGMVSFLVNADSRDVNRILWDAISALHPSASMEENARRINERALKWVDTEFLQETFVDYVMERKSFKGLVEEGMDLYADAEIRTAEEAFVKATKLRDDNYIPFYYLGLINYDKGNYDLADFYYQEALNRGADEPLTYYALGVNAFAANRFDAAENFLQEVTAAGDTVYRQDAEELLDRISSSSS